MAKQYSNSDPDSTLADVKREGRSADAGSAQGAHVRSSSDSADGQDDVGLVWEASQGRHSKKGLRNRSSGKKEQTAPIGSVNVSMDRTLPTMEGEPGIGQTTTGSQDAYQSIDYMETGYAAEGSGAASTESAVYTGTHAQKDSNRALRIAVAAIASIIYWPFAIVGVASPFMEGFSFGSLAAWQVIFARIWLAVVLLGFLYALVVNLGGIRNRGFFQKAKPLKIAIAVVADVLLTVVVIKAICLI